MTDVEIKNFLIVGPGRSGTAFLAAIMNKSKKWTVAHEPPGTADNRRDFEIANKRLAQDYYGEVNSYLLFVAHAIKVGRLGVIFRAPSEVWISIANRRLKDLWVGNLDYLERAYAKMIELIEQGATRISFRMMTASREYLQNVISYFGIKDLEITAEIQSQRINMSNTNKYTSLADFSEEIRNRIYRIENLIAGIDKLKENGLKRGSLWL